MRRLCLFTIQISLIVSTSIAFDENERSLNDDQLHPYSVRFRRQSLNLTSKSANKSMFETWKVHSSTQLTPVSSTKFFVADILPYQRYSIDTHVYGHHTVIRNPMRTFSVYEAVDNGCRDNRQATVQRRAREKDCLVAQNGGYFDTQGLACHGNVISDGKVIQNNGKEHNVVFGITSNGSIITGYLTESDVTAFNFTQLITGVGWLVKNGTLFLEESLKLEESVEETGTLKYFADVQSARTAIGHDRDGHVVFVQVDGQTNTRGPDLHGFAKFLIDELDLENAINLDGGGSTSLVLNGTFANYPSDHCESDPKYRCMRRVSTVICAHRATCQPACVTGTCHNGRCVCERNWVGESCDTTECSLNNCTNHGNCTPAGCLCLPGWHGNKCDQPCSPGFFGTNCSQICRCENGALCHQVSGECSCLPGFHGKSCDLVCPHGKYGVNCSSDCHCSDTCLCHPDTGTCHKKQQLPLIETYFKNLSLCVATNLLTKDTVQPDEVDFVRGDLFMVSLLCGATVLLVVSLSANFALLWKFYSFPPPDGAADEWGYSSDSTSPLSDAVRPLAANKLKRGWKSLKRKIAPPSGYRAINSCDENDVIDANDVMELDDLSQVKF